MKLVDSMLFGVVDLLSMGHAQDQVFGAEKNKKLGEKKKTWYTFMCIDGEINDVNCSI